MTVQACRAEKAGSMADPLPHKLICHGCLQQSANKIHQHAGHVQLGGPHGGNSSGRGMLVLHIHRVRLACKFRAASTVHSPKCMNPPCVTERRKLQSPKNFKQEALEIRKEPRNAQNPQLDKVPQEKLNLNTPFIGSPWGGRQGASPMSPEEGSRHVKVYSLGFLSLQLFSCL